MKVAASYRKYIVTAFCAAVAVLCFSIPSKAYTHTQMFPFVRVQRDPVRMAMGVNGYAYPSAISTSSWVNPATIPFASDTLGISVSYQYWQPESAKTHNVSLGTAWNIKRRVGISFGLSTGFNPAYDITNELQAVTGHFAPRDLQVNMGLSVRFCGILSLGANVHYTSQELARNTSFYNIGFDAFLLTKIKDFSLTAGVSSLGTPVRKAGGGSDVVADMFSSPTSIAAGVAFRHVFNGGHAIDIVGDFDYYIYTGEISAGAGFGATIGGIVSLRAGYHYGETIPSHVSTGIGLSFFGVDINASYLIGMPTFVCPMKNTFCVSLGYRF